jgi:DNA-binding transcriptional MerR regulator/methylmalonyl-CoA mutase cobalamin-binding subunit
MNTSTTPRHPIRVVAQRTGLTTATIRAWERRYDAVQPTRSEGGQRLYSDHDVERLRTLRELTGAGRSISSVADLSPQEAADLLQEDRAAASVPVTSLAGSGPADWVDEAYARVEALDAPGLERSLWNAAMRLGALAFLDDVVAELLHRIGSRWVAGELAPGPEHMASEVIDRVLERLADRSGAPGGPVLVAATLPGERHGLGARLAFVAASLEGWNVTYLGTDLPEADIASAAETLGADAVAISVVGGDAPHRTLASLVALRDALSPHVDILVGGRGSGSVDVQRLPAGVSVVGTLDALSDKLRGARRNGARVHG